MLKFKLVSLTHWSNLSVNPLYFADDLINDVGKFCIGRKNAPIRI